jgi:hypothetical protein
MFEVKGRRPFVDARFTLAVLEAGQRTEVKSTSTSVKYSPATLAAASIR